MADAGIRVAVSGRRDDVLDMLRRGAGGIEKVRAEFFPTQVRALETLYPEAHPGPEEESCSLREVVPGTGVRGGGNDRALTSLGT